MVSRFDVAVVGLGAMGSAAARALSARGLRVVGFDRFSPPHDHGSSHGQSRIIREAYFEDPAYVPLVQRSFALWDELQRESGRDIFLRTGMAIASAPGGLVVEGARRSARAHKLAHEDLTASEMTARWTALTPTEDMECLFEPRAGVLFPEVAIEAQLSLARRDRAQLFVDEPVLSWRAAGRAIVLETERRSVEADRLVLASGAWMPRMLGSLGASLSVERQVQLFIPPAPAWVAAYAPSRCPVFAFEPTPGRMLYGFPDLGFGVKVALHHGGESADPEALDRTVRDGDVSAIRAILAAHARGLEAPHSGAVVCMYTNAPDEHFVLGPHPEDERVIVASACSGHGFKFAPVVGEAIADLVDGRARPDLARFSPARLSR